jgi:hypothetical protein
MPGEVEREADSARAVLEGATHINLVGTGPYERVAKCGAERTAGGHLEFPAGVSARIQSRGRQTRPCRAGGALSGGTRTDAKSLSVLDRADDRWLPEGIVGAVGQKVDDLLDRACHAHVVMGLSHRCGSLWLCCPSASKRDVHVGANVVARSKRAFNSAKSSGSRPIPGSLHGRVRLTGGLILQETFINKGL